MGLFFLGLLLTLVSIFMMMLILVQRGKGGGLTGALGGMGGQSAFGSKAGDLFTRITVVTAMIWITLCMLTIAIFNPPRRPVATVPDEQIMSEPDSSESTPNSENDFVPDANRQGGTSGPVSNGNKGAAAAGDAGGAGNTGEIDIKGPEPNQVNGAVPIPQVDEKTPAESLNDGQPPSAGGQSEQGQLNDGDQAPDPSKKASENAEHPNPQSDGNSPSQNPDADSDGG